MIKSLTNFFHLFTFFIQAFGNAKTQRNDNS